MSVRRKQMDRRFKLTERYRLEEVREAISDAMLQSARVPSLAFASMDLPRPLGASDR